MTHLLMHFFGLDNASGTAYLAWSGVGGDISQLAIVGAVIGAYHKHNCHEQGCWRIGRHLVDGTPYCNIHHEKARGER